MKSANAKTGWEGASRLSGLACVSSIYGFLVLTLLLAVMVSSVAGKDPIMPTFGQGPIKVSLYTDYFCPPCRIMEPELEPILVDLVKKGRITLTFVDTPTSPYTSLYARYFLYAVNAGGSFEHALLARNALFEAAAQMITEREKLEGFLKDKGVEFKAVDVTPTLVFWNRHLKENNVSSTPTCVMIKGDRKEFFQGPSDIIKAMKDLTESQGEEHVREKGI